MANADWLKIKNEYITTNISQRKLAEKYNISPSTLTKRANREQWHKTGNSIGNKIATKTEEKLIERIADKEVNRIARIFSLADRLSDKLERAIDELDISLVTNKRKTKVIEYKDNRAIGKPTKEIIDETEEILRVVTIVDRAGIKQLASALKDIKDIQYEKDGRNDNADNSLVFALQQATEGISLDEMDAAEPEADSGDGVVDKEE